MLSVCPCRRESDPQTQGRFHVLNVTEEEKKEKKKKKGEGAL